MSHTGLVIPAAGQGSRLGYQAKALLKTTQGLSFLEQIATTAKECHIDSCVVVAGAPFIQSVSLEAKRLNLMVIENTQTTYGMAASVSLGFSYLKQHHVALTGALLWPVDHGYVSSVIVHQILNESSHGHYDIVLPSYQTHGGHPTWFSKKIWQELIDSIDGKQGARDVVYADSKRVCRLVVDSNTVISDVDTPTDLTSGH